MCGIIGSLFGSVYSWMSRSCWIVRPGSDEEGPLGADRRAELLKRVVLVGRDRDDLRVGDGDLRTGRRQLEMLLVLLRAVVAAREGEDHRVAALELAEAADGLGVVRAARSRGGSRQARCRAAWSPPLRLRRSSASGDELLAAVDVERRPGQGRVRHDVDGQRGDVLPDRRRARSAALRGAARDALQLVTEERSRQRGVDETRRDEVDADRGELEREVLRRVPAAPAVKVERTDRPTAGRRPPVPPTNSSVPPGRTFVVAQSGDPKRQPQMPVDVTARLVEVHARERRVVGTAGGDQHVVDRRRQLVEEPVEPVEVGGVEGRTAQRAELRAARSSRSGSRAVRTTSAPSARARRAVSRPMPALPPITTTVCPSSSLARSRRSGADRPVAAISARRALSAPT